MCPVFSLPLRVDPLVSRLKVNSWMPVEFNFNQAAHLHRECGRHCAGRHSAFGERRKPDFEKRDEATTARLAQRKSPSRQRFQPRNQADLKEEIDGEV